MRGPGVFREYWNRPAATAESFDDGWFRTGDMAVLERGYYRILGRLSVDIIKSGGYKLSALEIETALLDHPDIFANAPCRSLPDDTWGEAVAVAVVLCDGAERSISTRYATGAATGSPLTKSRSAYSSHESCRATPWARLRSRRYGRCFDPSAA